MGMGMGAGGARSAVWWGGLAGCVSSKGEGAKPEISDSSSRRRRRSRQRAALSCNTHRQLAGERAHAPRTTVEPFSPTSNGRDGSVCACFVRTLTAVPGRCMIGTVA